VKTLNAGPVSYDNSHQFPKKIEGTPTWEPDTFTDFNYWLPKHKYYVGFGTWIGITLFYATQFVQNAVGFEGDPVAFANGQRNLNWNKHRRWYNHTQIYPVAVLQGAASESTGEFITMRSSGAGGSCSFVGDPKIMDQMCGHVGTSWEINGYTLPHLLNLTNIPVSKETFIKIDVESYEWDLIPSWIDWLKNSKNKPTFRVAFHNSIRCGPQDLYDKLVIFSKLYKDVWMDGKKTTLSHSFNLTNCLTRTLDFSDHDS
jgi:FkbM family methyltransferase